MKGLALGLLVLATTSSPLFGQGALQRIRTGPPPRPDAGAPPAPQPPRDDKSPPLNWGAGAGEGLGALVVGSVIVATSPIWAPNVLLDDNPLRPGYYLAAPYADGGSGLLRPDPDNWGCPDDLAWWKMTVAV